MEAVFQERIHDAKAAGTTVLLSSHILAQVEVLADRISIIRQGEIVETGALTELRALPAPRSRRRPTSRPTMWRSCPECTPSSAWTGRYVSRSTASGSMTPYGRWRRAAYARW